MKVLQNKKISLVCVIAVIVAEIVLLAVTFAYPWSSSYIQYTMYLKMATVILGILAVTAVVAVVWKALLGTYGRARHRHLFRACMAIILVLAILAAVVLNVAEFAAGNMLKLVVTEPQTTDYEGITSDWDDWYDLAYEIAEEGMVLMENEDGALPLASGTKVNLLGYHAYNPYYSGGGSGSISAVNGIDLVTSLENAGIEVNPAIAESGIYDAAQAAASVGFSTSIMTNDEVSMDTFTGDISFENLAAYSDTAIIVLARTGSEGFDLTDYEDGDYLEIFDSERALLDEACAAFDKVIVLLNTANAMELDFLNEYDIDAVLWVGLPGAYGFQAVGELLTGAVNPSGKLPDTWVYDNDSAPANENFGEQEAENASGRYYVDYVENIYVGYKWYETAYAENAVITTVKTGKTFDYNDYDSIVRYPFGYGLSYTMFDEVITGGISEGSSVGARDTISVDVEVTNTGYVAGKDTVELYVTVPYTDYDVDHGVEKSAVSLCGYGKTDTLEPGESEVVTIEVAMEDISSYDSTYANAEGTYGSYMLDAGDYIFSVRSDAHTVVQELTVTLADQYFFSGDDKRDSDDQQAYNQFDDAARGIYLSRNNGFANYTEAMNSVEPVVESLAFVENKDYYDESLDDVVTEALVQGVDYDAPGDLTVWDMAGLDYDDPLWDDLISQMSINEMVSLMFDSTYQTPEIDSIGLYSIMDSEGPLGLTSMFSTDVQGVSYSCLPILSATFNDELAYTMGSYTADQLHYYGITGWQAPAMDTHRSAYSGRNYEYYSEDGVLGAGMAGNEVLGARDKGVNTHIKHFALNDMETNRDCVHTYSSEQAIREIYLRPFEAAVKVGGTMGVMTSMNYIGDTYAAGHVGLLTEVLRNEWGFRGMSVTDMDQALESLNSAGADMRAGTDTWLGFAGAGKIGLSIKTDADIYYLQRAAHDTLYSIANSVTFPTNVFNYTPLQILMTVSLGIMAACAAAAIVLTFIQRPKRKKAAAENPAENAETKE